MFTRRPIPQIPPGDVDALAKAVVDYLRGFNDKSALTINEAEITASQGIKFPATQVLSTDANNLDDYEEGTWTPVLKFGGGTTGITYGIQQATYTKVGRFVSFSFRIQLTNKGSSVGVATITGAPFAAGQISGLNAGYFSAIGAYASVSGSLSGSTISLYGGAAGTATALADTDFANASDLVVNATYAV